MKKLWKGTFNYQRQVTTDWVRADTQEEAWRFLCIRIAGYYHKTAQSIRNYFNGEKDNYEIEEVIE